MTIKKWRANALLPLYFPLLSFLFHQYPHVRSLFSYVLHSVFLFDPFSGFYFPSLTISLCSPFHCSSLLSLLCVGIYLLLEPPASVTPSFPHPSVSSSIYPLIHPSINPFLHFSHAHNHCSQSFPHYSHIIPSHFLLFPFSVILHLHPLLPPCLPSLHFVCICAHASVHASHHKITIYNVSYNKISFFTLLQMRKREE